MWGERVSGAGSTPYTWLSSITLLPWLPSFPPQAFPPTISCLTSPWLVSLQSTAALALGFLHIPKLQLPATVPSRGPVSLSRVCMTAARTVWFWFHLGCYRSAVSLSALNVSPLTQTIAWIIPLLQFPHPLRAGPVLLTLLFPLQFLHPTEFCMVPYILFCWSGTPVHSQQVFCRHFCVWRYIPDASMERDILHIHLLPYHLVLSSS